MHPHLSSTDRLAELLSIRNPETVIRNRMRLTASAKQGITLRLNPISVETLDVSPAAVRCGHRALEAPP